MLKNANDLLKKLKDVSKQIQEINDIKKKILNIFLILKDQSRQHVYNSLLKDWKLLLEKTSRLSIFNVALYNSNRTLFKIDIWAFLVTFSLSLKLNSNFNIKLEGFPEPQYYLFSFRNYIENDASFILDGSISSLLSTGGIEGRINLSGFKYQFKTSINILQYQNEFSRVFYYKIPEFVLSAYKEKKMIGKRNCRRKLFIEICDYYIYTIREYVSEVRTPSYTFNSNWGDTIRFTNKNEIIQYEDNNEQKSNQQKNWILYNI